MLGITCSVLSVLRIEDSCRILLGLATHDETVALLGVDIVDKTFLTFEIILYPVRFVGSTSILEYRQTYRHASGINAAAGMDNTTVHIHLDDVGSKFNLVVPYFSRAIEKGISGTRPHHRVVRFIEDRSINGIFLLLLHLGRIGNRHAVSQHCIAQHIPLDRRTCMRPCARRQCQNNSRQHQCHQKHPARFKSHLQTFSKARDKNTK